MSYLHTPRLSFSGDFLSDVSTVNNDPAHYNNETFEKSFQEFGQGSKNGWWNPEGGAVFDFKDCTVKQLVSKDGTINTSGDLIGEIIKGADGRSTGKMVDLDPQQQGVSQLWAVRLRILTKAGDLLLDGFIEATAFRDLQYRQTAGSKVNGQPLGGSWTSVLKDITWGKKAADYPFFKELRDTTHGDKLSVNLNGFGYYYAHATDGRFSLGRLLGAIGPWFEGEPETFVAERRLYGTVNQNPKGTQVYFSNTNFLVDQQAKRLSLDFGASFPVANSLGKVTLTQKLVLGVSNQALTNGISTKKVTVLPKDFILIDSISYKQGDNWLMNTCGLLDFENLDDNALALLKDHQLVLLNVDKTGNYTLVARESIEGYLLRADNFVVRLDTDQSEEINFYARQWGEKMKATVTMDMQPATPVTPVGPNNPISEVPGNNYPQDGLSFKSSFTLADGHAKTSLKGNKIINPRGYLDGQIYFIDYALKGITTDPAEGPMNNDSLSIHLRDYFEVPDSPVWSDIAVTLTQFSNLYPIMSKYIVDLSDPEAVKAKAEILKFAFSRNIEDPIYMPVTRDLSETKRLTILKWLENPVIAENEIGAAALKSRKPGDHTLAESPAKKGTKLTEKQERLKTAMRAKSGEFVLMDEYKTLNF